MKWHTARDAAAVKSARERIVAAACAAFAERGFAAASTLEIATRARVSKRELYALFGSKQQMLITCVSERVRGMRLPADWQPPRNRRDLEVGLVEFGAVLLSGLSEPDVVALYRLAVSEADRFPKVAQVLDVYGRQASAAALREMLEGARSVGLLIGADVEALLSRFLSLVLDDVPMSLALGLRTRPGKREIARRAIEAARAALAVAGWD
jgi:AcrR family transcriptional regulator